MPDIEEAKTVFLDYTMTAAKFFTEQSRGAVGNGVRLRFVYLSGGAVERDQNKPLWFLQDYRRIRVSLCLV